MKLMVAGLIALALGGVVWKVVLPRVWSSPAAAPIALDGDPVLEPLEEAAPLVVERSGRRYVVQKLFAYEAQGEVLSASSYDVTWTNDFADVDVALLWGPRREALKDKYKFSQMGLWLFWRSESEVTAAERLEIGTHISNNHLIPADGSSRLAFAFRRVSKGDVVRIKGSLVRISSPEGELYAQSSVVRDDTGDGACEVIWVDEVQIGERVFR